MTFEEMEKEGHKKHWDGPFNKAVRLYFYSQRGLAMLNEFRYLFMLIFGVYYTLKLTNPFWLVGMFLISVPLLIIAGWFNVHRYSAIVDWLNVQFATYWAKYGYSLSERSVKALEEINQKIGKELKNGKK